MEQGCAATQEQSIEEPKTGQAKGKRRALSKDKTRPVGEVPKVSKKADEALAETAETALSLGRRNAELGRRGEDAAARFLDRRGYDIIERNWTCLAGEADIIARDGKALVFVEVKTRSSTEKGLPSEAVDAKKRRRYERIAALFLQGYEVADVPVRFDVVSLVAVSPDRALVRHHINAFAAG